MNTYADLILRELDFRVDTVGLLKLVLGIEVPYISMEVGQ